MTFDYEKFRREFKQILSEGENLGDEEKSLIDLIAMENSSKCLLGLVRELKEDGNFLFKEKKIDEALEKYGYAGVLLVCHEFNLEEDKAEFFDLAVCLLLNLTACLSRKDEFVNVGQICSLVLDYNPNNVKALFRRAKAARKLGKNDLAFWDLMLAVEVDPNNKEVCKELEEVKNALKKDKKCSDSQGEGPSGLGTSLPTKKKPRRKEVKDETIVQGQLGKEDRQEIEIGEKTVSVKDSREINSSSSVSAKITDELVMKCSDNGFGDSVDVGLIDNVGNPEDMLSTAESQGSLSDSVPTVINNENSKLEKPKFRFQNRKKHGSFLDITKSDYLSLTHGRILKFYNVKLGTYMEVRVVHPSKKSSILENGSSDQGNISTNLKQDSQVQSNEGEANASVMEESCEPTSIITSEDNMSTNKPYEESHSSCSSCFCFTSKSKCVSNLKRFHGKARNSSQDQAKLQKRRKLLYNNSSLPYANLCCGCRFNETRKRKCVDFHPVHPPRKKICSGSCNFWLSSFDDVSCNTSFNYFGCSSVSYELAHGPKY